uniref:G domain-containing protein n=1 Tax=Aplanochytrium stocchinoi TaxID=215587 RepID=A0A7S3LND7_9STRA
MSKMLRKRLPGRTQKLGTSTSTKQTTGTKITEWRKTLRFPFTKKATFGQEPTLENNLVQNTKLPDHQKNALQQYEDEARQNGSSVKSFRAYINSERFTNKSSQPQPVKKKSLSKRVSESLMHYGVPLRKKSNSITGLVKRASSGLNMGRSSELSVMFLGIGNAGKTTLFRQFVQMSKKGDGDLDNPYVPTDSFHTETISFQRQSFKLLDIGGSYGNRVHWMQHLRGVNTVIFVVAIDEYDQKNVDGDNSLLESLEVFEGMRRNIEINNINTILILNKVDVFKDKLCNQHINLNVSGLFPDARATEDFDEAMDWLKQQFRNHAGEGLEIHITTAINNKEVQQTIKEVARGIIKRQKALKWSALL